MQRHHVLLELDYVLQELFLLFFELFHLDTFLFAKLHELVVALFGKCHEHLLKTEINSQTHPSVLQTRPDSHFQRFEFSYLFTLIGQHELVFVFDGRQDRFVGLELLYQIFEDLAKSLQSWISQVSSASGSTGKDKEKAQPVFLARLWWPSRCSRALWVHDKESFPGSRGTLVCAWTLSVRGQMCWSSGSRCDVVGCWQSVGSLSERATCRWGPCRFLWTFGKVKVFRKCIKTNPIRPRYTLTAFGSGRLCGTGLSDKVYCRPFSDLGDLIGRSLKETRWAKILWQLVSTSAYPFNGGSLKELPWLTSSIGPQLFRFELADFATVLRQDKWARF